VQINTLLKNKQNFHFKHILRKYIFLENIQKYNYFKSVLKEKIGKSMMLIYLNNSPFENH